ncbi:cholinesterase 1 [Aethina tumida]|uniref:cholinesterase 1 n=1 Tax=Aethina tumida TaxID=116153 RepID=UPI00214902CF|nr:cholinesterase 1 [Aethina tumida]
MQKDNEMENEDCLYLNVYTPIPPGEKTKLPVLIFIHGGGFVEGSSIFSQYGPHRFMTQDIVVVTFNYRLGPFGFLSTGDTVLLGNNGLKDQNLALKWVQQNIDLFGGDREKVTIYGQSAGAASVAYHMLSKKSSGLFRAAYLSSGSALCPFAYQRNASDYAHQLVSHIFGQDRSFESLSLRMFMTLASAKDIDVASGRIPEGVGNEQMINGFFYAPVIEPEHPDAFITESMYESFLKGDFNKVPTFVGLNSNELYYMYLNPSFKEKVEDYENPVSNLVIDDFHIQDEQKKLECGKAIREIYSNGSLADDLKTAVDYFSDVGFSKSIIRTAEILGQYTDVYFYELTYELKLFNTSIPKPVIHGEDILYIWNDHTFQSKDNARTSDRLIKLITNFVKTLNPTPTKDELLDNVEVPKVKSNSFTYVDIGESLMIKENPKGDTYKKWKKVYEDFGVRPFDTY